MINDHMYYNQYITSFWIQFQYKQNCNSVQIPDYTCVYKTAKLLNYFATSLKYQAYENEFQPPTTRPPPNENEKSDNKTEKEPTPQTADANTNQVKYMPQSLQNNHEAHSNNSEGENPNIDIITLKTPEKLANNIMTQRTIEIATAAVIINNRITTPVTLEIRPGKGNATTNVANSHKKSSLLWNWSIQR